MANARVTSGINKPLTNVLGVTDLTRPGGVFVIPIAAAPAAQFALLARTNGTGDDICPECNGKGRLDGSPCPNCGGSGTITRGIGGA